MRYTEADYLANDPFDLGDRDVKITGRAVKIVTTRAEHTCIPPLNDDPHKFPAGSRAYLETAFVEGVPSACYVCAEHMDQWIDHVKTTKGETV